MGSHETQGEKTLATKLDLIVYMEKIIASLAFTLTLSYECMNTHTHTHAHRLEDANKNSGSSKLHGGSYASSDALLLSCQLLVTEDS